jgi:hypothetical protein
MLQLSFLFLISCLFYLLVSPSILRGVVRFLVPGFCVILSPLSVCGSFSLMLQSKRKFEQYQPRYRDENRSSRVKAVEPDSAIDCYTRMAISSLLVDLLLELLLVSASVRGDTMHVAARCRSRPHLHISTSNDNKRSRGT